MSEQNKAVVRRLFEDHWNRKNRSLADELYAPSAILHTPDGVLRGLQGATDLFDAYATAFPDFHLTLDDLVAEGDKVAARWTFEGTHRGPLAGIAATGKRVNVANGVAIYRVAGGKIAEGNFAWDKFELMQQLGVLPAAGTAGV
ncbi:MAG: ester cyclase [Acidobacteria bacterium]|nr:MAG: ester cyclase [Acidobacteriota bacterium]